MTQDKIEKGQKLLEKIELIKLIRNGTNRKKTNIDLAINITEEGLKEALESKIIDSKSDKRDSIMMSKINQIDKSIKELQEYLEYKLDNL